MKDLDRFDMIVQAFEYEQAENSPGKLQEFFDSTHGKFEVIKFNHRHIYGLSKIMLFRVKLTLHEKRQF